MSGVSAPRSEKEGDCLLSVAVKRAKRTNGSVASDADDRILFRSLDEEVVDLIVRIKHNDPGVEELKLEVDIDALSAKAWMRLGQILGNAEHLSPQGVICQFHDVDIQQPDFCRGLQTNEHFNRFAFYSLDLQSTRMGRLDSLLRCNPSLKYIFLCHCELDSTAIHLLATALLGRKEDTLEDLRLQGGHFGDMDLDTLVKALARNVRLEWLSLNKTGIGSKACASLAKLLSNHPSLSSLELESNAIDDNGVSLLVDSLAKNTKSNLRDLHLGGNKRITSVGWSMLLRLLCDSSTIENVRNSNHTLHDLGWFQGKAVERAMGTKDYNLLRASLDANSFKHEMAATWLKILWSHAGGDFNIGASSVPVEALPRILAWVGGGTDDEADANGLLARTLSRRYDGGEGEEGVRDLHLETIMRCRQWYEPANYIQYHDPPLPKANIDAVRLDSVYRIVRSRPWTKMDASEE